jgi:hypothetical protein
MAPINTNIAKVLLNNDLIVDKNLPGSASKSAIAIRGKWKLTMNIGPKIPKFAIVYLLNKNYKSRTIDDIAKNVVDVINDYSLIEKHLTDQTILIDHYVFEKTVQYENFSGIDVNMLRDELILEMIQKEITFFNNLDLPVELS